MRFYSVGRNLIDDGGSGEELGKEAAFANESDSADIIYWPPTE